MERKPREGIANNAKALHVAGKLRVVHPHTDVTVVGQWRVVGNSENRKAAGERGMGVVCEVAPRVAAAAVVGVPVCGERGSKRGRGKFHGMRKGVYRRLRHWAGDRPVAARRAEPRCEAEEKPAMRAT